MKEEGITLIEIIIAVFIVALFSVILISDFPRILKQFALSRSAYHLIQDLRRAQDLGLSGVEITDKDGYLIKAKGYGFYLNLNINDYEYYLYADRGDNPNLKYDSTGIFCDESQDDNSRQRDCVLEIINLKEENLDLFIKEIRDSKGNYLKSVSINFLPPNPTITIIGSNGSEERFYSEIEIVLSLKSIENITRRISINNAGLIYIKYD